MWGATLRAAFSGVWHGRAEIRPADRRSYMPPWFYLALCFHWVVVMMVFVHKLATFLNGLTSGSLQKIPQRHCLAGVPCYRLKPMK